MIQEQFMLAGVIVSLDKGMDTIKVYIIPTQLSLRWMTLQAALNTRA